jgi:hypothetical protein
LESLFCYGKSAQEHNANENVNQISALIDPNPFNKWMSKDGPE